jgi:Bacterial aa3 type cytochrome c oxidase subunit IV.
MASDYHRGDMDIHEQVATYHLFVMMAKWGSLALAALLVFLVLLFCTPTGFFGSLIVGVVISVAGWFVLREHPGEEAH